MDDEFYLTGTSTGTHCEGKSVTKTITEKLHIARSCKHPLSGTIEIKGDRGEKILDFGAGECDSEATITGEKGTKQVDLDEIHKKGKGKKRRK